VLIKVISLTFDSIYGGFNDGAVREFLKDKELLGVQDHLIVRNDVPYLVFVLKYMPYRAETDPKYSAKVKEEEPWRKMLTESDMGLFNLLRDWRSERAKKEGMPPYVLFTNQQFAMIVKKRPQTLGELAQIEGVGQGKVQKYGQDILNISKVNLGGEKEKVKVEEKEPEKPDGSTT